MSERETNSDSELYDIWFREKVQEALHDLRPCIPHDVVMDEAKGIIDRIAAGKAKAQRLKRERFPE
jgi:hypothetical protein